MSEEKTSAQAHIYAHTQRQRYLNRGDGNSLLVHLIWRSDTTFCNIGALVFLWRVHPSGGFGGSFGYNTLYIRAEHIHERVYTWGS